MGVDYADDTRIESVVCRHDGVHLAGKTAGNAFSCEARFLIDSTGPRGLLHRALNLHEEALPGYPKTQALWSHFEGVARPPDSSLGQPPYPPEDAAVHHVFDGGWIWVLRFNNGITSAGVAATDDVAAQFGFAEREAAWQRILAAMPSLKSQFARAQTRMPLQVIPRVAFLSEKIVDERWAMLPSAAGFVDPLLSTGFPLTLLGIERLAKILEAGLGASTLASQLDSFEQRTKSELRATARLVGALYSNMHNFAVFRALTLLYFAAASFSETARRLGKPHLAQSFLLHDQSSFGMAMRGLNDRAMRRPSGSEAAQLINDIRSAIERIDVAGLSKPNPRNWYPVDADDLLASCAKVDATPLEVAALLQRCGFYPADQTA
jgi:FADH2 O2-dependent halogenase